MELSLIVAASALLYRYGNVVDKIREDGFQIDAQVYSIIEGDNPTTMAKSTGLGVIELSTLMENLQPDVVLTVADRFETMSTAIAASYMNIPLAHTQGGEVTGSIDESVRHAITKLSHLHLVTNDQSQQRVLQMGEDPDSVFITGCPSIDAIASTDMKMPVDFFENYGGTGPGLDPSRPYLVVLQHPVTTEFGQGLEQINETLSAVHTLDIQAVWLWPNIDAGSDDISKGLRMFRTRNPDAPIHFFRNFGVEDYARLIKNSACLLGNSSSGIREGAFLGVPVVNIGSRQKGRERAHNVIDVGYDRAGIEQAVRKQIAHGHYQTDMLYGDGRAGPRIAEILANAKISIQKSFFTR
ncbi:UDP-N-acetylglucosamine 2-epimerase [Ahrensia marina]|uniref:UDP-N-acetylglucosamine 2-epimerase n=1 Tax=Ahrensia marina TaxID=1514904 RepID=UPI0035CFB2BD